MTSPPLYQVVGGELNLNFHAGQLKAWDSLRRIILVLAGTQGGKTDLLPAWLWREIKTCGPGDYGFVSPTFTLMEKKALPSFKYLFEEVLRLGKYTSAPVPSFTFSPQGEVQMFGAKQTTKTKVSFGYAANPDSLESSTWKAAVLDEAGQKDFKGSSYDAILRRLSIAQGRILIGTTPYQAGGWLKTRLYDRWKAGDKNIEVVNFPSNMNPVFPAAEWERAKRDLPAWKFALFYMGLLTRPAGLIYDSFDTAKNMARRFPIPANWPRYIGMDFGAVNTAAVCLAAEVNAQRAKTGKYFAYRTYHPAKHGDGRKTPVEHVKELLAGEPGVPTAVGGSMSEDEWRCDFGRAGLHIREPAIRDVEVGIDRVYGTLKRAELVIFDDLEDLQGELESYSRELDDAGEPTEKIADKANYHLCFIAGTMVSTRRGQVPIESIRRTDQILTRHGFYPLATRIVNTSKPLWRVEFSNGRELVGTADHPVFIEGKGFTSIDSLRYGDIIYTCQNAICKSDMKQLRPSVSGGFDTLIPVENPTDDTFGTAASTCIVWFGSCITGKYRKTTTSTTRTMTPLITLLRTLNCSLLALTKDFITPAFVRQLREKIWIASAHLRRLGTHQVRAKRGIVGMALEQRSKRDNPRRLKSSANIASACFKRFGPKEQIGFAALIVGSPLGVPPGWTMRRGPALTVERTLSSTNTAQLNAVPVHVLTVTDLRRNATVYNLQVGGPHEYFANGVLVSNCDALRYVVGWLKTPPTGGYSAGDERKPIEPSVGAIREVMGLPGMPPGMGFIQ